MDMSTTSSPAAGIIGQAIRFAGNNDAGNCNPDCNTVYVADTSALQPNELTLAAWVYNAADSYPALITKGIRDFAGSGYGLYRGAGGLDFRLGGTTVYSAPGSLATGRWYHDGQTMEVYVNGKDSTDQIPEYIYPI